jgi:hypothetical protein
MSDLYEIETLAQLELLHNNIVKDEEKLIEHKDRLYKLILDLFLNDQAIKAAKLHKYMVNQAQSFLNEANPSADKLDKSEETKSNSSLNLTPPQRQEALQSILTELNQPKYRYIREITDELEALLENVKQLEEAEAKNANKPKAEQKGKQEEGSWKKVSDSDGIHTFYRKEPNKPTHSFMVQGEVQSSLFNVLSLIYEIDLYKNW